MSIQIQQHSGYTGVQLNPGESWNVNLVTIVSKLVMAFLMFAAFTVISIS